MHSADEVVYTTRLGGRRPRRTAGPTTKRHRHPASDHCPSVPPITSPFRETDRHNHHDQPDADHVHEHRPDVDRLRHSLTIFRNALR